MRLRLYDLIPGIDAGERHIQSPVAANLLGAVRALAGTTDTMPPDIVADQVDGQGQFSVLAKSACRCVGESGGLFYSRWPSVSIAGVPAQVRRQHGVPFSHENPLHHAAPG